MWQLIKNFVTQYLVMFTQIIGFNCKEIDCNKNYC